jgi:hypothetical protein
MHLSSVDHIVSKDKAPFPVFKWDEKKKSHSLCVGSDGAEMCRVCIDRRMDISIIKSQKQMRAWNCRIMINELAVERVSC